MKHTSDAEDLERLSEKETALLGCLSKDGPPFCQNHSALISRVKLKVFRTCMFAAGQLKSGIN